MPTDITLFQHDGFSIKFRNKNKSAKWIRRINDAVRVRADQAGIITELEVEQL